MTSCADDGICNAAVCGVSGDPDCRPDNCNADGRCVTTCDKDPDCPLQPDRGAGDERVVVQKIRENSVQGDRKGRDRPDANRGARCWSLPVSS